MPSGGEGASPATDYPHIKTVRQYYPNQKYNKDELVFNKGYVYKSRQNGVINEEPTSGVNQKWAKVTYPKEYYPMLLQLGDNQNIDFTNDDKIIVIEYDQAQNGLALIDYSSGDVVVEASTNNVPLHIGDTISGWYFYVNGIKIPNWGVYLANSSGAIEDGNLQLQFLIKLKYNTKDNTLHSDSYIECLCNMY